MCDYLPGEVAEPVSEQRTGQRGAGPAPLVLAVLEMDTDGLSATTNAAEVAIGAKGNDATAVGTSIALEIKALRKPAEVPGGKAVPPDLVAAALGTDLGPHPRIILALLKNILEQDGDKIYHDISLVGHRPR